MNSRLLNYFKRIGYKKFLKNGFSGQLGNLIYKKLTGLEKLLGYKIIQPELYIKAITHSSFNEFYSAKLKSNERLEFLGDAVIGVVIGEFLFKKYKFEDEGFLTKVRSQLVSRSALGMAALRINLIDYMLINDNLFNSLGKGRFSIISNALEALVGAIYLDKGIVQAEKFINKHIIKPSLIDKSLLKDTNYKSQLLEFAQAQKMPTPIYHVIKEEGPQHSKSFTVEVFISDESYGIGSGNNKKSAEQNAAHKAIQKLKVKL